MAKKPISRGGKFIYALIENTDPLPRITGIGQAPVYVIRQGEIGAVVSDLFVTKVRPERRNLTAHQTVLKQLAGQFALLPMRFGILAQGTKAVSGMLMDNEVEITEQLRQLAGKVEMGLRVKWDVDNIYEYFVDSHPKLKEERDRCLLKQGACESRKRTLVNRNEMIELGRCYEQLMQEQRAAHQRKVESVLQDTCYKIRSFTPKNEREVMNLACLIDSRGLDAFEQNVLAASALFNNDYLFNYTGPWAPHSFVDLRLQPARKRSTSAHLGAADTTHTHTQPKGGDVDVACR